MFIWSNCNQVLWSLYFFLKMFTPIWVIKLLRYPVPTKPFDLHSHHTHSCACLVLLGFWRVILPLAGVPEEQWDANGGQSHHSKCSPVKLENRHWDVSKDSLILLVARFPTRKKNILKCTIYIKFDTLLILQNTYQDVRYIFGRLSKYTLIDQFVRK